LLAALGTDYLITALAVTLPLYILSSIHSQRTAIRQQVWREELIMHLREALND